MLEKWTVEHLIRRMQELNPGETITLAGWYDAVDEDCYCARVIQRVDASAWGWTTGQVGVWLIGRYQYAEPMTVITDLDEDYLEEDVKAYLTENELFEDGETVYVRV